MTIDEITANDDIDMGSDHRCVKTKLIFELPLKERSKGKKIMCGWTPALDKNGKPSKSTPYEKSVFCFFLSFFTPLVMIVLVHPRRVRAPDMERDLRNQLPLTLMLSLYRN